MIISTKLKERFCKDCNIPIHIFKEPYFTDRLKLFDKFYGTLNKWNIFLEELQKYNNEQDYFEEYNRVKDDAIDYIKKSAAYIKFNEEDMNQYRVKYENLPNKDIFKETNDGRTFISIDMKKANFSSLHYYSADMFGTDTWEEFINKFTDNKHIINSKYIRQVILGNCNPKRHITYEKYLMGYVLDAVLVYVLIDKVVFFSNDEVVIDISDLEKTEQLLLLHRIKEQMKLIVLPLRIELFNLNKIYGTDGYYKEIFNANGVTNIEFKCLDNYMLPFVIRHFLGEEIIDNDKVFYHEGLLAQYIEVPKIEVKFNEYKNKHSN